MRITIRSVPLCLVVATLVSGVFISVVSAQNSPMTDEQIGRIRISCVSARNTLNRLHASDALLRVNRGQIYESMTTKLMSRFNNRVDSNRLDGKSLILVAQDYGTALTEFREDYKSYEEQLAAALKIDCSREPVSFYDAVALARTKRTQVHVDVVKLHQYIDDYKAAFVAFETEFNKTDEANN